MIEAFRRHSSDEIMVCTDYDGDQEDYVRWKEGCGPFVACDTDGCCVTCGCGVEIFTLTAAIAFQRALASAAKAEGRE